MKKIFSVTLLAILLIALVSGAQTIPVSRITDWSKSGMQDTVPSYSNVLDIMNYGGSGNGTTPNDVALQSAITALGGPGVIYFPAGTYLFSQSVYLGDSIVLRGNGRDSSKLIFDLGGAFQNMINIAGSTGFTTWDVTQPAAKNDTTLVLNNTSGLAAGDWVILYGNDSSLITSVFAYETVGQIFRIKSISGDTITSGQALRREYTAAFAPRIKHITPVTGTGIECLYLQRRDSTPAQTTNISLLNAVNCWVIGVESFQTNFAHIGITASSHILVRGNYLHHSHGYGGTGNGYGVVLQYTSGDCLVENNQFEFLRHSMLLQAGANGNVLGYNYSKDPNWTEPSLPANSAGDAVLHGNYPYLNLFEGNVVQNIIVDNSHGINGPFNTFFRNRAQLYGIFQNSGTGVTNSVNYVGNEVTNTSTGLYSLAGTGHFQYGNNVKGTLTPTGTNALPEKSLYLSSPPAFWDAHLPWPHIGTPYAYNQGMNTAQLNQSNGMFTDCSSNPHYVGIASVDRRPGIAVYPNPARGQIIFIHEGYDNVSVIITDIMGRNTPLSVLVHTSAKTVLSTVSMQPGIYLYRLQAAQGIIATGRLRIE